MRAPPEIDRWTGRERQRERERDGDGERERSREPTERLALSDPSSSSGGNYLVVGGPVRVRRAPLSSRRSLRGPAARRGDAAWKTDKAVQSPLAARAVPRAPGALNRAAVCLRARLAPSGVALSVFAPRTVFSLLLGAPGER